MYPQNTARILSYLFPALEPQVDYRVHASASGADLDWLTGAVTQPTEAEILAAELPATNAATWAAQSQARKDREAKAALALPDSDDPVILRRKLNAALHLIQR